MSKYNHMKSISFSEIPENDIGQAIREWAQGNRHMERLLWACRINGIETTGCHPLARPYLGMVLNNSHSKIRNMLNSAQTIPNSMVLILPDGGNPISGEKTWYQPTLTIVFDTNWRRTINKNLDMLYEAITLDKIQDIPQGEIFAQMLDFYDFFAQKQSGLNLYMGRNKKGEYKFEIINRGNEDNQGYYEELLSKAGMQLKEDRWTISSADEGDVTERIKKAKDIIIDEYSLDIPTKASTNMDLTMIAQITKRNFGETIEGQRRFSSWLNNLERSMRLYLGKKISYEELITNAISSGEPDKKDNDDYDI